MTPDEQDEANTAAEANATTDERTKTDPPAVNDAPAFDPETGEILSTAETPADGDLETEPAEDDNIAAEADSSEEVDDEADEAPPEEQDDPASDEAEDDACDEAEDGAYDEADDDERAESVTPSEVVDWDDTGDSETEAAPVDEPRGSGLDADTVSDLIATPDELGGPQKDDDFELEFDDDEVEPAASPAGEPPAAAAAEPEVPEFADMGAEIGDDTLVAGETDEADEDETEEGEDDEELAGDVEAASDEDFEGEVDEEFKDEVDEETEGEPATKKEGGFSRLELLEIIFSRKTKLHFAVLLGTLILFLALSIIGADWGVDLILLLGYGLPAGYLITGLLTRYEAVQELCRSDRIKSLILPLVLALVIAGGLYYAVHEYGLDEELTEDEREVVIDDRKSLLGWGLIAIFFVWQFAQAWWMRIPFREFALDRVRDIKLEGHSLMGRSLNIAGPLVWLAIGFAIFSVMSTQGWGFDTPTEAEELEADGKDALEFDNLFKAKWVGLMLALGALAFFGLYRLQREYATGRRVAVFSGYFALGYWAFLAYHGGVLLYSLAKPPSFYFDLILMTITILVVIYSLSVQALKSEGLINRHNVIFFSIAFTMVYGASSFFLTAGDDALIDDPKNVGRISHTIVLVSGILVILLTNLNFMKQEGLITGGLLVNMQKPEVTRMKSMDELSDESVEADGADTSGEAMATATTIPEHAGESPPEEPPDESAERET